VRLSANGGSRSGRLVEDLIPRCRLSASRRGRIGRWLLGHLGGLGPRPSARALVVARCGLLVALTANHGRMLRKDPLRHILLKPVLRDLILIAEVASGLGVIRNGLFGRGPHRTATCCCSGQGCVDHDGQDTRDRDDSRNEAEEPSAEHQHRRNGEHGDDTSAAASSRSSRSRTWGGEGSQRAHGRPMAVQPTGLIIVMATQPHGDQDGGPERDNRHVDQTRHIDDRRTPRAQDGVTGRPTTSVSPRVVPSGMPGYPVLHHRTRAEPSAAEPTAAATSAPRVPLQRAARRSGDLATPHRCAGTSPAGPRPGSGVFPPRAGRRRSPAGY